MEIDNKITLPAMYKVAETIIPPRLSIQEREIFLRGLGVSESTAKVVAVQDRASSVIGQLTRLLEQSNDPRLLAEANRVVLRWNEECDAVFQPAPVAQKQLDFDQVMQPTVGSKALAFISKVMEPGAKGKRKGKVAHP